MSYFKYLINLLMYYTRSVLWHDSASMAASKSEVFHLYVKERIVNENLISECFSVLRTECSIHVHVIICRILTFFSDLLLVKRFLDTVTTFIQETFAERKCSCSWRKENLMATLTVQKTRNEDRTIFFGWEFRRDRKLNLNIDGMKHILQGKRELIIAWMMVLNHTIHYQ